MRPTAWQAQHLELGLNSPWLASYITPVYPEDLGDCQTLIDALTPDVLDKVRTDAATATDSQLRNSAAAVVEAAAKMAAEEAAAGGGPMLGSRSSTAAAMAATTAAEKPAAAGAAVPASGSSAGYPGMSSCRVCGSKPGGNVKLQRCSRCKSVEDWYCSRDCQKRDWIRHKRSCVAAGPSSAAGA